MLVAFSNDEPVATSSENAPASQSLWHGIVRGREGCTNLRADLRCGRHNGDRDKGCNEGILDGCCALLVGQKTLERCLHRFSPQPWRAQRLLP
jgi:hypothetical protein